MVNYIKKYWHLAVLCLVCLTPLIWLIGKGSSVLINGLDTNFPLDPVLWLQRRFFVWNNIANTGQDFSSGTSGIFFHLIQTIPYLLGFSLHVAELLSLIFWFSLITTSSYLFSKILFPRNNWARLTLVILYTFNIYLFNTWENVKVSNLSLYVALPFLFWILFSLSKSLFNIRRGFLYLVGLAIIASGTGINPAYFSIILLVIILFGVIFGFAHLRDGGAKKIIIASFFALAVIIGTNLFWILPLTHHLIGQGVSGLSGIGYTDWLSSLSKDTSLVNVMRLQGAWDWYIQDSYGMPIYLPYTLNYFYKFPFIVFSFVPPILAFVSLIFAKKEKKDWYLFAATLMLLGIFFGSGSHPPTGDLYLFLSQHLPMFSFFRSPWYIFTPLLTIAYSILIGLLVERVILLPSGKWRFLPKLLFIIFWVGYFLYNYPLITGKIFRPGRTDSYYVNFPDYLWQSRDYLDKRSQSSDHGRIITYPDDQLETFSWGYRGTDSIMGLFSDVEFISPTFTAESESSTRILETFYKKIKDGEYESAQSLLPLLGADTIFIKRDTTTNSHIPEELISESTDKSIFGEWVFINEKNKTSKIFSPAYLYADYSKFAAMAGASLALPPKSVVINGLADSEINKTNLKAKSLYITEILQPPGDSTSTNENRLFTFKVLEQGEYQIYLEKKGVHPKDVTIKLDSKTLTQYEESDDFIIISANLDKNMHKLEIIFPASQDQLVGSDMSALNIPSGLRGDELPSDRLKTITLYNTGEVDRSISFNVKDFAAKYLYVLEFDYKYFYGSDPSIEFCQFTPRSVIVNYVNSLGVSTDWKHKSYLYKPLKIDSNLDVYIKMPRNVGGGASKTFIENLTLKRVYDNQVFILKRGQETLNSPEITFHKVSPVEYSVKVAKSGAGGYTLAFLEKYSKDWELVGRDLSLRGVYFPHFMINGYANAWYIPQGSDGQTFTIYYWPQILFNLGLCFSFLMLISAIVVNYYPHLKYKNRKNEKNS